MQRQIRNQLQNIIKSVKKGLNYFQKNKQCALLSKCIVALQSVDDICANEFSAKHATQYTTAIKKILQQLNTLSNRQVDSKINIANLIKSLDIISHELTHDEEIRKEIIFLPYKASMWDSLESIWKAADEDENCDAYVIPIPYCDRNPDGSAAKWHLEADQYPAYVPITDCRQYDMAKQRPDAIYIHNPYDGYNIVTSVDPHYYSSELKKYTDMLVYVPYFVVGAGWPESHLTLSAYKNADKIIVQHDSLRVTTVTILENQHKKLANFFPCSQLIALGSPKIDHVIYCGRHKNIPAEWEKIINGRKVIMYNVSLSGILSFNLQALKKIKYIFTYFEKYKEICLLWRPHPLVEATLNSMRPDLAQVYKKLKNYFINNSIGIFDTTPDVDKSVAAVDAYIGEDSSSVTHLFGAAGKPEFFTDMFITKDADSDEKASMIFSNICLDKDVLYFTADTYNTLCKINLKNKQVSCLAKFTDFPFIGGLYGRIIKVDGKLILPPFNAKTAVSYDLKTGEIEELFTLNNPMDWGNFAWAAAYGNNIYFIPYRYPSIIEYNLNTREVVYYKKCLEEFLQVQTVKKSELFSIGVVTDSKLLIPALQIDKFLEFDMASGNWKIHKKSDMSVGTSCIVVNDDEYWLIPFELVPIRKWNYKTNEVTVYNQFPRGFKCDNEYGGGNRQIPFSAAVKVKNKIWLFPCMANMIMTIDMSTGDIEEVNLSLPYKIGERKSDFYNQQANFFFAINYKDKILALSAYDRNLLLIDPQTKEVKIIKCRMDKTDVQKYFRPMQQSDFGAIGSAPYATNENGLWRDLDAFCKYVQKGKHDNNKQKEAYSHIMMNMDGTSGKKIHEYIMEQINEKN